MKQIISFLALFSSVSYALPLPKTIYLHVLKNKPSLNKTEAKNLAAIIYEVSIIHKINPLLYSAMLRQESWYKVDAISYKKVFNKTTGKIQLIPQDFGIAQINYKTIEAYGFDKHRLVTDLRYSIEAGAIVLKDIKRRFAKYDENWWTFYNGNLGNSRQIYHDNIMRWM